MAEKDKEEQARRRSLDVMLDHALEESFPASDPVAISIDAEAPED